MITFFLQMRRTLRVLWSIFKDDETRGIAVFYCSVGHFFMQM